MGGANRFIPDLRMVTPRKPLRIMSVIMVYRTVIVNYQENMGNVCGFWEVLYIFADETLICEQN